MSEKKSWFNFEKQSEIKIDYNEVENFNALIEESKIKIGSILKKEKKNHDDFFNLFSAHKDFLKSGRRHSRIEDLSGFHKPYNNDNYIEFWLNLDLDKGLVNKIFSLSLENFETLIKHAGTFPLGKIKTLEEYQEAIINGAARDDDCIIDEKGIEMFKKYGYLNYRYVAKKMGFIS